MQMVGKLWTTSGPDGAERFCTSGIVIENARRQRWGMLETLIDRPRWTRPEPRVGLIPEGMGGLTSQRDGQPPVFKDLFRS